MNAPVVVMWSPGERDDDLQGFVTAEERDAHGRGEPGPFQRIVRNHHKLGPVPFETRVLRNWLDGKGVRP